MPKINKLIARIESDINSISLNLEEPITYKQTQEVENQIKMAFTEAKNELNLSQSKVKEIENKFFLNLGNSYWNYGVTLEKKLEKQEKELKKLEGKKYSSFVEDNREIIRVFEKSYDAYQPLFGPKIKLLSNIGKAEIHSHACEMYQKLAAALSKELSKGIPFKFQLRIKEKNKEILEEIMECYRKAMKNYQEIKLMENKRHIESCFPESKGRVIALNYLYFMHKFCENENPMFFQIKAKFFIDSYNLQYLNWDIEEKEKFQFYLNKTQSSNNINFFNVPRESGAKRKNTEENESSPEHKHKAI